MKKSIHSIIKHSFFPFILNALLAFYLLCVWLSLKLHADVFGYTIFALMFTGVIAAPIYFAKKRASEHPWRDMVLTVVLYAIFNVCVYLAILMPQKTLEAYYTLEFICFDAFFVCIILADIIQEITKRINKERKSNPIIHVVVCVLLAALMHVGAWIAIDYEYTRSWLIDVCIDLLKVISFPAICYTLYFAYKHNTENKLLSWAVSTITHDVFISSTVIYLCCTYVNPRVHLLLLYYLMPLSIAVVIVDSIISFRKQAEKK